MTSPLWDLRLGRWQDVLADVGEVDAVITDPPFSERTASGYRSSNRSNNGTEGICYGHIDQAWVDDFVDRWAPAARWWFVAFSDHIGQEWYAKALARAGLYVFAPVAWVKTDSPPRFQGDGPASQIEYLTVARPRHNMPKSRIGSRPGFYLAKTQRDNIRIGGKPAAAMRAIVGDYTRPGDLVCDPCAGGGTTLLAASELGRRSIGAEMDPDTYAKALARLSAGHTPDLFASLGE